MAAQIRWMLVNKDIEGVLAVAKAIGNGTTEEWFYDSCHADDRTNYVLLDSGKIVGFIVVKNLKYKFQVMQMGLHGASTDAVNLMFYTLEDRLTEDRRRIEIHVPEGALDAQLLLRDHKYRAVRTYADENGTEFYVFVRKVEFPNETEAEND